jgi:hypothetical protein
MKTPNTSCVGCFLLEEVSVNYENKKILNFFRIFIMILETVRFISNA